MGMKLITKATGTALATVFGLAAALWKKGKRRGTITTEGETLLFSKDKVVHISQWYCMSRPRTPEGVAGALGEPLADGQGASLLHKRLAATFHKKGALIYEIDAEGNWGEPQTVLYGNNYTAHAVEIARRNNGETPHGDSANTDMLLSTPTKALLMIAIQNWLTTKDGNLAFSTDYPFQPLISDNYTKLAACTRPVTLEKVGGSWRFTWHGLNDWISDISEVGWGTITWARPFGDNVLAYNATGANKFVTVIWSAMSGSWVRINVPRHKYGSDIEATYAYANRVVLTYSQVAGSAYQGMDGFFFQLVMVNLRTGVVTTGAEVDVPAMQGTLRLHIGDGGVIYMIKGNWHVRYMVPDGERYHFLGNTGEADDAPESSTQSVGIYRYGRGEQLSYVSYSLAVYNEGHVLALNIPSTTTYFSAEGASQSYSYRMLDGTYKTIPRNWYAIYPPSDTDVVVMLNTASGSTTQVRYFVRNMNADHSIALHSKLASVTAYMSSAVVTDEEEKVVLVQTVWNGYLYYVLVHPDRSDPDKTVRKEWKVPKDTVAPLPMGVNKTGTHFMAYCHGNTQPGAEGQPTPARAAPAMRVLSVYSVDEASKEPRSVEKLTFGEIDARNVRRTAVWMVEKNPDRPASAPRDIIVMHFDEYPTFGRGLFKLDAGEQEFGREGRIVKLDVQGSKRIITARGTFWKAAGPVAGGEPVPQN